MGYPPAPHASDVERSHDRAGRSTAHGPRLLAPLVGAALLVAACGGAGPSRAGVARLPASSGAATAGPGVPAAAGTGTAYEQQLAYSQCMRSHGVPDFPDPVPAADGGAARRIEVQQGSDLDPAAPRFQAAYRACRALGPAAPPGRQQDVLLQRLAEELAYSSCMRSHGTANFPDPVMSSKGVTITLNGIDTDSPAFRSADAACQPALSGASGTPGASGGTGPGGGQP